MAKKDWPLQIDNIYQEQVENKLFHVDYLKTTFNDFARLNLYKVEFVLLDNKELNFSFLSSTNREKIEMTAKSVNIPAFDIGRQEFRRMGQRVYLPSSQSYGDIQAIILCDDNYSQRKFLHSWMKHIVYDTDNNVYQKVKVITDNYMIVRQFDNKFNTVFAAKFWGIWPNSIGEIQFSQDSDAQFVEFPVTFSYSTYEILTPEMD